MQDDVVIFSCMIAGDDIREAIFDKTNIADERFIDNRVDGFFVIKGAAGDSGDLVAVVSGKL